MPPDVEEWLVGRAHARHERLTSRLDAISGTQEMPAPESVTIGSAREARAVVLFADLVNSTSLAIRYAQHPESMLATLNVLIPTLQDCADWYGGEFEKNTGDGLLVYFGVSTSVTDELAVKKATVAGQAMLWSIDHIVNPELEARGLRKLSITIGADIGDILLARVGVARQFNPLVAVGLTANRAAKIQDRCMPGQFRVGEDFQGALPREWRTMFTPIAPGLNWPFQVAKSASQIASERREAERGVSENQVTQIPPPPLPPSILGYAPRLPSLSDYATPRPSLSDYATLRPAPLGHLYAGLVHAEPVYPPTTRPYRVYLFKNNL